MSREAAQAERKFSERRTLLLVDLGHDVEVDETNDDVATDIDSADGVEHIGVLERDALRHLHHTEDDDQVGTALILLADTCRNGCTSLVLSVHGHRVASRLCVSFTLPIQ